MYKFWCCVTVLLLLTACAKTRIHLIVEGYNQVEKEQIKQGLESEGNSVVYSKAIIPDKFANAAIAINPTFSDSITLSHVKGFLEQYTEQTVNEYQFAQGNHFYHDGHMGVYLRNPNYVSVAMPDYLRTQYCKFADATIMFNRDKRFVLEYEANLQDENLTQVNGSYHFDGSKLTLASSALGEQHYTLVRELKQTYAGEKPADVYKPHSTKHELKPLNCEFLIIYMD